MATLRDIAEEVGVSIRTVSRALSGSGYVRAELRARITSIAERVGYRPDPVARTLRLGSSREIIVVSHSVDELHMAKIASLERYARPRGCTVSVVMAHHHELDVGRTPGRNDDRLVSEIRTRRPAGVAVIGSPEIDLSPLAARLFDLGIACVPVDSASSHLAVTIDRPAGVAQATRHLVATGRRRIVYLGPAGSRTRIDGFRAALADAGRAAPVLDPGADRSRHALAASLLDAYPDVDAVQCYSDEWALELLAGLHARGVCVPDDVAVVGFDDRWAAEHSWPALTTVAQPGELVGEAVGALLIGEGRDRLFACAEALRSAMERPDDARLTAAGAANRGADRATQGLDPSGPHAASPFAESPADAIPTRLVVRESA